MLTLIDITTLYLIVGKVESLSEINIDDLDGKNKILYEKYKIIFNNKSLRDHIRDNLIIDFDKFLRLQSLLFKKSFIKRIINRIFRSKIDKKILKDKDEIISNFKKSIAKYNAIVKLGSNNPDSIIISINEQENYNNYYGQAI